MTLLPSGYNAIRVNKSANLWVVVAAVQEIESRFGVVIIFSIPYRVDVGDMGRVGANVCIIAVGYIQQLSPRAVVVPYSHVEHTP